MAFTLVGASLLSVPIRLAENYFNGLLAGQIAPSLLVLVKEVFLLVLSSTVINVLRQGWVVNVLGYWTASGERYQWHQVWGLNGCALPGVALGRCVSIIGSPRGHCLFAGFVVLGLAEARFVKIEIFLQRDRMLRCEERKNTKKKTVNVWVKAVYI